jgi:putative hydrolase of the HAD superfamily
VNVRTLDTVLFDLDDTLHDDSRAYRAGARETAEDVARERGIDAQALTNAYIAEANAFWKRLSEEHLATRMTDTRAALWMGALRAIGIDDAALAQRCSASYVTYRKKHLHLEPGALELLDGLKARGMKLGIITNGFAETHHEKIALLGLTDRMDAIFIADEVGMVKPDVRLFRHACEVMGTVPERAAMVGDRYERDCTGALAVGMFAVLVDVHAIPVPAGAPKPHAIVARIADVAAALPVGAAHA